MGSKSNTNTTTNNITNTTTQIGAVGLTGADAVNYAATVGNTLLSVEQGSQQQAAAQSAAFTTLESQLLQQQSSAEASLQQQQAALLAEKSALTPQATGTVSTPVPAVVTAEGASSGNIISTVAAAAGKQVATGQANAAAATASTSGSNYTIYIIAGVAILAILAGGYFMMKGKKS